MEPEIVIFVQTEGPNIDITLDNATPELAVTVDSSGPPGPAGTPGYTPQRGVDYWTDADKEAVITEVLERVPGGGSGAYQIGDGLKLVGNILSVDTAAAVEADNTKPITSAAVFTTVGNIETLLKTI